MADFIVETEDAIESVGKEVDFYVVPTNPKRGGASYYKTDYEVVDTWQEFEQRMSIYRDYDDGYGLHEIPEETAVVFKDGCWLSRWEYDGSEGWVLNCAPKREDYDTSSDS